MSLDYTIEKVGDNQYQVWTPDDAGACLGSGITPRSALEDATRNMEECVADIKSKLASE